MKISDIETRLDDTLTRLAGGASAVDAAGNDADVQELVRVAQRLQSLAPTPEPRLANSRRRFLAQAARQRAASRWTRLLPRRVWAFALTVLVLVAASAVMLVAWSAVNRQNAPVFQVTLTQTVSPTYAATPAGGSQAPAAPVRANRPQFPEPCPTPGTLAMLGTTFDDPSMMLHSRGESNGTLINADER